MCLIPSELDILFFFPGQGLSPVCGYSEIPSQHWELLPRRSLGTHRQPQLGNLPLLVDRSALAWGYRVLDAASPTQVLPMMSEE